MDPVEGSGTAVWRGGGVEGWVGSVGVGGEPSAKILRDGGQGKLEEMRDCQMYVEHLAREQETAAFQH